MIRACASVVMAVVAVLVGSPVRGQLVESQFNAGTDGWSVDGNGGVPLMFAGDHVVTQDSAPQDIAFIAPAKFLGDLGLAYRGSLVFELLPGVRPFQPSRPAVELTGGTAGPGGLPLILRALTTPPATYFQFEPITVELGENNTAWEVVGEGRAPTPEEFRGVLGDLVDLRILADSVTASDEFVGLRSVRIDRPRVRVIIAAGQSNMSGCSDSRTIVHDFSPRHDVILWNQNIDEFGPVRLGTSDTSCGRGSSNIPFFFGPEWNMADSLERLFPDDLIVIIKFTDGGTSLFDRWNPPGANPDLPLGGTTWNEFIAELDLALATLDAQGYQYSIEAMAWAQGESDGTQSFRANRYDDYLPLLIASVRGHVGVPDLPFVLSRTQNTGQAFDEVVRTAQVLVTQADPRACWFDTDDFIRTDMFHYDAPSMLMAGERFGSTLRRFLGPVGDVNLDGRADIDDLHFITQNPVDMNCDGVANQTDIELVLTTIRAE
jgi:hypothetical protein